MPHFRRIDYNHVSPNHALLIRARLHIVGGKHRLQSGKISLGIITLYDALNSAMQWYVSLPEHRAALSLQEGDDLRSDYVTFELLVRSGIINSRFSYEALNELVDMALKKDMSAYDYAPLLETIHEVMTSLGVTPFDEGSLNPNLEND